METSYVLELEHLTKMFGQVAALSDVTLAVQTGEIYALLGENGAGKTTLFKILAGLHRFDTYSGLVKVDGRTLKLSSPQDALRTGIGIVSRRPAVFGKLSVAENISVGAWEMSGKFLVRRDEVVQRARAALDFIGLRVDLDAPAGRLTAGQQRLLVIARAISHRPKIVVLDEPTAFLGSVGELSQLLRTLRLLAERNIACLYLTRRPAEAVQLADRVTVLRDGCTNGTWSRMELDEPALIQAMVSQRFGDGGYIDHDEVEETGGILGSLRSLFSFGRSRD